MASSLRCPSNHFQSSAGSKKEFKEVKLLLCDCVTYDLVQSVTCRVLPALSPNTEGGGTSVVKHCPSNTISLHYSKAEESERHIKHSPLAAASLGCGPGLTVKLSA